MTAEQPALTGYERVMPWGDDPALLTRPEQTTLPMPAPDHPREVKEATMTDPEKEPAVECGDCGQPLAYDRPRGTFLHAKPSEKMHHPDPKPRQLKAWRTWNRERIERARA